MNIYENISQLTGNTPLVRLNQLNTGGRADILCKLEIFNPSSSVKDRIAVSMIDAAEKDGKLKPGGTIIEATSGNTGLGLAIVAATRGYKLFIVMPETMSVERRLLMEHLGAELILTPGVEGMQGAVRQAEELLNKMPNSFSPRQFMNPANPATHKATTAVEIWNDADGQVDIFIAGVGTGGTLSGVASFLKEKNKDIKIIAVEPASSAVLSGENPGRHKIEGIGAGFIPEVLDRKLIDNIIQVSDEEAMHTARMLARMEGILCGTSSGANVFAALQEAKKEENEGKNIVTIVCDTGERYLSTDLFS